MSKNIAILGATSHIAKGLIFNFTKIKKYELFLFARAPQKVKDFLRVNNLGLTCHIDRFKRFKKENYDAIINCVGLGTPEKVREASEGIFKLTDEFDSMILQYLHRHPGSLYINFSSGAVYNVALDNLGPEHYYGIAKLYQEAKHRALKELNIVDVRVFSYFSRFIDLNSGYFLTELIRSLKEKKFFVTDSCDFVRDFIAPQDIFGLIRLIIKAKPFNGAVDAYSSMPVKKSELLEYFVKNYALKYSIDRKVKFACPTGKKVKYAPSLRIAAALGYKPKFSSLNTVIAESKYILGEANAHTG